MSNAVISLIVLVLAIVIANVRKINVGAVALAAAMILGLIYGLKLDQVLDGINVKLIVRMFAVQLLVVIARENGTLQYVAQKVQLLCRGRTIRFFPIILYVLMLLAELAGFNLYAMFIPVLAAVAYALNMDMLAVGMIGIMTMFAGCFSPYSVPGIMFYGYVADAGLSFSRWNLPILCLISYTALFLALYFYYGWHKATVQTAAAQEKLTLTPTYLCTLLGYACVVGLNLVFHLDTGITACIASLLLCLFGFADAEKAVKEVPYSILLMIAGMTSLIGVIEALGGIDLLSSLIADVSGQTTAPILLTILAGIISLFTSASNVVQPTLISSIPRLAQLIPGVSVQSLASGVAVGSYAVALSPLDASGAQIMAAYGAVYQPNEEERLHMFNRLLKLTGIILIYQCALFAIGFYQF